MCQNLKGLLDYEAKEISAHLRIKGAKTLQEKELHAGQFIQHNSERLRKSYCGRQCPERRKCKSNRWLDNRHQ
jgi:hypothetical protein